MATRSELGISPFLLQAIATLTSSASSSSTLNTVTTSSLKKSADCMSNMDTKTKPVGDDLKRTNSASVVSQLLQNLNQPVTSLMSKTSASTAPLASSRGLPVSDTNQAIITQAGLSMLGISSTEGSTEVTVNNSLNAGRTGMNGGQQRKATSMALSNEEISHFLMKEEPSEEEGGKSVTSPPSNSTSINTDVSNMLTALASQHVQESLSRKNNSEEVQGSQGALNTAALTTVVSSQSSTSETNTRSQPQIIIYSYINNNGQEVSVPVSSPQGSANDILVSENDGNADVQTTYRVLLQQPQTEENNDTIAATTVSFPPEISYSVASNGSVLPVTDAHNTQDGMNQPCPVCGDRVSGYHYGIFTCESCKGFFKRTVQNKKNFVCPKSADCSINSINRKKCPACRFNRCLQMGMKLEAIRQDRTRGGRSSYEGCGAHLKNRLTPLEKKMKKVTTGKSSEGSGAAGTSFYTEDGSKSHRNLVAILNHNVHKQTPPNAGEPHIPELLRDIMNLEPLLGDDDISVDSIMNNPFPDQAVYSYMMQLAELRLYKLVRWARNLPQFGAISTDDQILLLQNCWSELIALSLCWRSIDTPDQISISSTHHITVEWAQHLGFEDLVIRLLDITKSFRKLQMDQFEYVALKVLLLISPDVKGLKEPGKIRYYQDKLMEALLTYTSSHYLAMPNKFGELLIHLPELSRLSFISKDILIKSLPSTLATCGLLVELLKGDNKGDGESGGLGL